VYTGTISERVSHLEKSKLAQHAYEEGYRVGGNEAILLESERNLRRKNTRN
jgi:hypothetical protein